MAKRVMSDLDGLPLPDLYYNKNGKIIVRLPDDEDTQQPRYLTVAEYQKMVRKPHKPLISYSHLPVSMLMFGLRDGDDTTAAADASEDDDGEEAEPDSNDQEVYCICKKTLPSNVEFVGCENKDCPIGWFHLPCVGLKLVPDGEWYCDDCQKASKQAQEDPPKLVITLPRPKTNSSADVVGSSSSSSTTAKPSAVASSNKADDSKVSSNKPKTSSSSSGQKTKTSKKKSSSRLDSDDDEEANFDDVSVHEKRSAPPRKASEAAKSTLTSANLSDGSDVEDGEVIEAPAVAADNVDYFGEGAVNDGEDEYRSDDDGTSCYCKKRLPKSIEFVGCENEECPIGWFHLPCVKLNAVPEGAWYCPDCSKPKKSPKKGIKKQTKRSRENDDSEDDGEEPPMTLKIPAKKASAPKANDEKIQHKKSHTNGHGHGKKAAAEPEKPETEEDGKLYCYCKKKLPKHFEFIGCENDKCPTQWFHMCCVGLSKAPPDGETWYCGDCDPNPKPKLNTIKKRKIELPPEL